MFFFSRLSFSVPAGIVFAQRSFFNRLGFFPLFVVLFFVSVALQGAFVTFFGVFVSCLFIEGCFWA